MKRIVKLFVIIFLTVSCQPALFEVNDYETRAGVLPEEPIDPDSPIIFLPAVDMEAWISIHTLEERFAACEVPEERLKIMTTEAIVKSIMNYPLNFLPPLYDNPIGAVKMIVRLSSLHQELISREDAAKVLVRLYAAAKIDLSKNKSNYDGDYTSLSYTNAMFMDLFIATGLVPGLEEPSVKQVLTDAVNAKIKFRMDHSEIFSLSSLSPLYMILELLGEQ